MDIEQVPLIEDGMRYIEPDADDQSFIVRRSTGPRAVWQQVKRTNSPILNWFLRPVFWLCLWVVLVVKNLEGVCFRSQCRTCRKKSGGADQMLISASCGCQDCALFVQVLSEMAPQIRLEHGMFTLESESHFKKFPLELSVFNVGSFEAAKFRFHAPRVCQKGTSLYPGSFHVSRDSDSKECMKLAETAVKDCVENHMQCRKPRRSPLPRRVLDVCSFDFDSDIKLYQSRGEYAPYIALSHSWGKKHTFMTKVSNLEERLFNIDLQSLPKTFQDAVFIARKLKIRYLWIDSLCIIQDNPDDWDQESPTMGAVYGNAYLTIAAGSALNDETGFLGVRSDFMYKDYILETQAGNCASIIRVQDLMAPTRRDPLSFRAWAFQERLLSKRTLYYHQQELVFECKQGLQCECMSCSRVIEKHRRGESAYWERLGVESQSSGFPRAEIPESTDAEDLRRFWREFIVPEYSARSLTRDTDRLPALSAVAATVQSLCGVDYLAGVWCQSLPGDLAWATIYTTRSRTGKRIVPALPSRYVAPSWCWASINGPVQYKHLGNGADITYRVSVIHAECTTWGSNAFSAVEKGSITLEGAALHGTCALQPEPDKLWPYRINLLFPKVRNMTLRFEPDVPYLAGCEIPHSEIALGETAPEAWLNINQTLRRENIPDEMEDYWQGVISEYAQDAANGGLPFGRVKCLLLYTFVQPARCEWVFLVLGHSSQRSGAYERLGIATYWVNGYDQWPELDEVRPEIITIL